MRIKTLCIVCALSGLIPIGGCDLNSAERVALVEQKVSAIQARSGQVDTVVAGLERFLAASAEQLADPNISNETIAKIAAGVAEAQARLAQARTVKAQVDEAMATWKQQLESAGPIEGPGDEIQLLGRGVTTVAAKLPPPFAGYAALVGGLITAVGQAPFSPNGNRFSFSLLHGSKIK